MTDVSLESFMAGVKRRNPGETEFHQAVREVAADIIPFEAKNPLFREARIFERLAEPDRVVSFRVVWETDRRRIRISRDYRVQWNNAIGPYKGGLRFHASVNQSILKFLAFEQTFKNSLTGLPIGGAKGVSPLAVRCSLKRACGVRQRRWMHGTVRRSRFVRGRLTR